MDTNIQRAGCKMGNGSESILDVDVENKNNRQNMAENCSEFELARTLWSRRRHVKILHY